MHKEFNACFENVNGGEVNNGLKMDIAVPLMQHMIPKELTKFSDQDNYLKENFLSLFMKEYWFHPCFKIKENSNSIIIEMLEDSIYLDGFETLPGILKKIKERTKGFDVTIEMEMSIMLNWEK